MNSTAASKVAPTPPLVLPAGPKLFVHPTDGDDSANSGAIDSPLKTIQEAIDRAAAAEPTPAVVLRGGTHYLTGQLVITHQHSDMHMLGYPGEEATVSGGVELTNLQWKKHNPPPAPPAPPTPPAPPKGSWITQDNFNYVFAFTAGDPNFPTLGKPSSAAACQA